MDNIKINEKQARQVALEIFADIDKYIAEHQAEYEEFLLAMDSQDDFRH